MAFQIVRNDITKVKADAIVNTANPNPTYGGGTDSAIYEAAGVDKLLAARKKIGKIEQGQAVETPAFGLNAKYIIHTVAPTWTGGKDGELDILRSCYENSLILAQKLGCKSIAFPLIATGVNGFPKDKALQTAMSAIQEFLLKHKMTVTLVVFSKKALELSGNIVEKVREYVDSQYVMSAEEKEYSKRLNLNLPPEEIEYIKENLRRKRENEKSTPRLPKEKIDIKTFIASPEKTFQQRLFDIIDARGLTGPQVYKNYISKQVFSKIQADKDYHPNKYTAIALCLSLHLDLDETKDLIGRAGWTLSNSNKSDLVVSACIMNGEYDVVEINLILYDNDCPELEKIK